MCGSVSRSNVVTTASFLGRNNLKGKTKSVDNLLLFWNAGFIYKGERPYTDIKKIATGLAVFLGSNGCRLKNYFLLLNKFVDTHTHTHTIAHTCTYFNINAFYATLSLSVFAQATVDPSLPARQFHVETCRTI